MWRVLFSLILLADFAPRAYATGSVPLSQGFIYQGRFLTSDGTRPMADAVALTLSIYSDLGNCLLYQETSSSIDLAATQGLFSVSVGSPLGDSKRTASDPGLTWTQIFSNSGQIRASDTSTTATCPGGYTPASGEGRKLRVTIYALASGATETLVPDLSIGSVPQATVAETLQGITPSGFLQPSAGANLSQSSLEQLTGGSDASTLHNHDSQYMKLGGAGAQNLGSGGMYTGGSIGVGVLTAPAGVQLQVKPGSDSTMGETIRAYSATQTADLLQIQNSSGTPVFKVDAQGSLAIANATPATSGSNSASDSLSIGGQYWNGTASAADLWLFQHTLGNGANPDSTLSLTHSGSSGTASVSIPSGRLGVGTATPGSTLDVKGALRLSGSTSGYVGLQPATVAGNTTYTLPSADGSGGQLLTTNGSGALSWTSPSSNPGTVTTVSGTAPIAVANGSSAPSISISTANTSTSGALSSSDWNTFSGKVDGKANLTTVGSLPFVSSSGTLSQDSTNLFWDPANHRLGIGTSAPASSLHIPNAPAASANNGLVSLGSGAWDGAATGFYTGSANGTVIAVNADSGFTGNLADLQVAGASKFSIDNSGHATLSGTPTSSTHAATKSYVDTAVGGKVAKSGDTLTGALGITQGALTSSTPGIDHSATWNAAGVTFTGIKSNITSSASAAGSLLMDLQVGGSSKFSVDKSGNVTGNAFYGDGSNLTNISGAITGLNSGRVALSTGATTLGDSANLLFDSTTGVMTLGGSGPTVTSSGPLTFSAGGTNQNVTLTPSGTGSTILNGNVGIGASTPLSKLHVGTDPSASANVGLVSLGAGPWDGAAGSFSGSSNGTAIGVNTAAGFAGNLADYQIAGVSKFKVDPTGNVTLAGTPSASSHAATKGYVDTAVTGKLSKAGDTMTGALGITQGTLTSSTPSLNHTATWNSAGTTFTNILSNVTDSASALASKLMDLQVGGTSKFNVDKAGNVNATKYYGDGSALTNIPGVLSGLNSGRVALTSGATSVADSANLTFNSTTGALAISGTGPSVAMSGSTSGATIVQATAAASGTLTLPAATDTLVGRATTDTLTNKTLTSPVISTIMNTGTLTLPTSTDTLVGLATTDTLSNKTLASPVMTGSISLTDTWNNVGTTFTHILANVTNTLSAAGSLLMDLQIGGTSKFKVDKNGYATAVRFYGDGSNLTSVPGTLSGLTAGRVPLSTGATTVADSASLTFNSSTGAMAIGGTAPSVVISGSTSGSTALQSTAAASGVLTLPAATDTLVGRDTADTLTNKTLTSPIISTIVNTGTLTLPTSTDTLVGKATTDTLTNKTLTSPIFTGALTETYTGTGTAMTMTADSLTSGNILSLSSSSTAAAAGNTGLDIAISGANTTAGITRNGLRSSVTATGGTSTNVAGYFSATGATNNYGLIVANGNVGIGTTAPAAKLDVNGTITATNLGTTNLNVTGAMGGSYPGLVSIIDNTALAAGIGGGVKFGGVYTAGGSTADAAGIRAVKQNATDGDYGFGLAFLTRPNLGVFTEKMRIDSSGNVGIGTTLPLGKLSLGMSSSNSGYKTWTASPTDQGAIIDSYQDSGSPYRRITDIVALGNQDGSSGGGELRLLTNPKNSFTSVARMNIKEDGNVGIGTTSPTTGTRLDITGTGATASSIIIPRDTVANRPATGVNGMIRYASDTNKFEAYENGAWANMIASSTNWAAPGAIGSSTPTTGAFTSLASTGYSQSSGNFAMSGTGTLGTGTGAISLNGDTTIAAGKNLIMASGTGSFTETYTGTNSAATITADSLTSGNILSLTSNSTAAASGNTGMNIGISGANATAGITRNGLQSSVTATGGTSTNVAGYFSATGATNNYGLIVANGNVGIGTTAPSSNLDIQDTDRETSIHITNNSSTAARYPGFFISDYTGSSGGFSAIQLMSSRGSSASPAAVQAWDILGGMVSYGQYDTTAGHVGQGTAILFQAEGNFSSSSYPTAISFNTVPSGSTTSTERMRISNSGNVGIGTSGPGEKLDVTGNIHSTGQVYSGQNVVSSGGSVDFNTGNLQILQSIGGSTVTVSNMKDGGSYVIVVTDTTSRTYTFSGCTNSKFNPANTATNTGTTSIYNILKATISGSTYCFISWSTGYQ